MVYFPIVEVFGEVLTYRVTSTKVVEPEETEALRVEEGKDLLTLVTCTPLGINTHRILLTGERVYPTPSKDVAAAGKRPDIPSFPWWAVALVAGLTRGYAGVVDGTGSAAQFADPGVSVAAGPGAGRSGAEGAIAAYPSMRAAPEARRPRCLPRAGPLLPHGWWNP